MSTPKRVRLTEAIIYRAMQDPPPPSAPYLWDSDVPGFAVRINPTGKAIYTFRRAKLWPVIPYADRLEVKRRGEWDRVKYLGLHAARREALRLMGVAHHAPIAASFTRKRRKQAEGQDASPTDIEQVFRGFCIDHLQKHTTIRFTRECESRFRRFVLPAWKGRDIRSITRKDVRE